MLPTSRLKYSQALDRVRHRRVHDEHQWIDADRRDRREVLDGIVRHLGHRRRQNGVRRRGCEQQAVAVGLGGLDLVGADHARAAGLVLDDHRLAERGGHLLGDHAADDVGRAGRRERHDQPHRALGILVLGAYD
jgi:hypothetical protein